MKPFIFIHIPKTGGTSIFHSLKEYNPPFLGQHSTLKDFEKSRDISELYKFSCIRNPWDRMVSWYAYDQREAFYKKSFSDFLLFIEKQIISGKPNQFQSQLSFLKSSSRPVHMDFIIRYENLQKDFYKVCDDLGIKRRILPKMNQSRRNHYRTYYNTKTRRLVEELYGKDISYFGYLF